MTAASDAMRPTHELLEIIDLKWLLAGDGLHIHVEKLIADADYARRCLLAGCASRNPTTRATARRIGQRLGIELPAEAHSSS